MIKMHLRSQGTARIICKYLCSIVITTLVLHSQSPSCVVHAQTQTCLPTSGCYPPIQDILKDPLDSFPSRTLTVSSTCDENSAGDGSYLSLGGSVSTFTCTNANVQPNNMLDNETTEGTPTYWQSKNMVESSGVAPEQQSVVFNFTDEFILHLVTVKFAALHVTSSSNSADARPASWTIDTFNSETSSWTTMRSFAKDCASSFPGTPLFDPFASNTDYRAVLCVQYIPYEDGDPFYDDDNYVEYNPGSFDTFGDLFKVNPSAAKFFSTTAIRLNFLTPPSMVPLKSYVAISDVIIDMQCRCNGHAAQCGGENGADCICQHNTAGFECTECLPLYNDRLWAVGTPTSSGACEICDCKGHATSCVYDATSATGICQDCSQNTRGDKCELCVSGYFVNPERAGGNTTGADVGAPLPDYCILCDCEPSGTNPAALTTCDVLTGQCSCKDRVIARNCSECISGYWGLTADNALGCNECACNPQGTKGNTNMCDKTDGSCECKVNVAGDLCEQCKPNTFNFDPNNPEGCTECECDPGASVSETCELVGGQCSCRSAQLNGRECNTPVTGYYVPKLDFAVFEPETAANGNNIVLRPGDGDLGATVSGRGLVTLSPANQVTMDFTFSLPFTGLVDVVVRFEKTTADKIVYMLGKLTYTGTTGYQCQGQTVAAGQEWSLLSTDERDSVRGGVTLGQACVQQGTYAIELTNPGSALLVDSVVLIPDLSGLTVTLAARMPLENITYCSQLVQNEVRPNRGACKDVEYSIMAALLNGAIACSCSGGAVTGSNCDPYSGDCDCLPGALPPKCDRCTADTYGYSATTGCLACGCDQRGSVSLTCSESGVCECRANVQGAKCNACLPQHYGLYTGSGCTPCQCVAEYSVSNDCDDTGQCPCLIGVEGQLCDACLNGFYNLSSTGCLACTCDPDGSTNRSCDVTTGACECLSRVTGNTCDGCKPSYFGLGQWHPDGCIECFCWGKSDNCSSAPGWFDSSIFSAWLVSDPDALAEKWQGEDMEGNEAAVETPVVMTGEGSRYALSVFTASTTATSDIFILAPPKFLGDRSPAYGRHLTVTTFGRTSPATAPVGGALPAVANSSATTGLDEGLHVILEGKYAPLAVSFAVGVFASDGEATAKIPVMEGSWKLVNTTQTNNTGVASPDLGYASFSQFMEILADLSSLKLKVYDTDVPGSVIDIISVHLENAVDGSAGTPNSGVSVVNNVGLCQCQEGYSGRLCELCAAGFTRVNPGVPDPSSLCVACTCNGHGVTRVLCDNVTGRCSSEVTGPCDPVSGVCECRHNTQGDHCQECLPGYYGDATVKTPDDCLPCACPGIIVANEINAFAATCQLTPEGTPVCVDCRVGHTGDHCERCQEGYFGTPENITNVNGICQPCACNGRADLCDTITGQCLDCRNDTAGHNCQICAPGFFGDPMTSECQPCTCDTVPGSTGACDHVTGVCECLPNVSGNNCDTCDDTTFNLTQGLGCQSCDCHQSGSLSVVCDKVTGQCPCRQRVEGRACDRCLDTYWNININTGCDECACNAQGTIKINDAIDPTCDVITGQCNCALEGIIGRTCDSCAPVSTYPFQYVQLFYIGEFPDCQLCGECFDSWAMAVEGVGADLAGYKGKLDDVWAKYDGKTQDEVGPNLDVIADKINQTTASLEAFKTVAQQLQNLGISFSEAVERQNLLAARTDAHAATELTQTATVTSLEALNDVVQGTGLTTVSLSGLQQQLDDLIRDSLAIANQGNSSWSEIQTLSFVVASPEDRERQLKQQAQRSMQLAAITNESFVVLKTGYETAAIPGVTENEREINSVSGRITNVTATLADARAVLSNVQTGLQQSQTTLDAMVNGAQVARETMLATVITLQDHVANSSIAQREAGKVAKLAHDFRTVADNAQQVMIDSMTSVIESFGSLSQTQNDMATAQLQSSRVQSTQLQPLSDMEQLVQQIDGAAVSLEDVTSLNVMASTALFVAEDAVRDSQEALQVSKQLKEEVDLMQEDVQTSRDLRVQVTGLKNASDSINTTARNVLEEAGTHINSTQEHVRAITATAQELSANISTLSNFYTTTETDVTNAATTAGQVQARAATATNNQQALLETMSAINAEADESGVAEALTTMTQAQIDITDLEEGLNQLITTEEMQALIQDLVSQGEELRVLDIEVDQLTSQLDILTVALQESAGGVTCKN